MCMVLGAQQWREGSIEPYDTSIQSSSIRVVHYGARVTLD
jgi:hypothetical protein